MPGPASDLEMNVGGGQAPLPPLIRPSKALSPGSKAQTFLAEPTDGG